MIRGRVIARDGDDLLIRTAGGDVRVRAPGPIRAGDLVELPATDGLPRRVRPYAGGDYPTPEAEVVRLGQGRSAMLAGRARMMAALRGFFAARDFLEVETPLLVKSPGLEVQLTAVPAADGWLITSPEYQMKRLLAGGLERIYQVCRCFRAEEEGAHHQREFTMLEWYRGWDDLEAIIDDTQALVAHVATAVSGRPEVQVGGRAIAVDGPWARLTVAEAMAEHAGVEVHGDEPADVLAARVRAAGIDLGAARAWDDVFYTAFVERVEPALAAMARPVLLLDWPAPLAALARRKADDPAVCERFEAYVGGVELANAFGELTDPVEQRARFEDDLATRRARGRPVYPLDEKLLAALAEGLPPCAGIALGVDRLAMMVLGATSISQVVAFTTAER